VLAPDVTDTAEVNAMVSAAISRFGVVEILVKNAGIQAPRRSSTGST
jgi:NAD(P)-dependent dehydrogenase (short-subunit alcohol dehydrogenase family)